MSDGRVSGWFPGRLSWRLLAAILPPVIAAVSVIVWLQYQAARRQILGAIDREIRFLSQRAAQEIDGLLLQRRRDLLTLSEIPVITYYYRNVDFQLHDEAESYRAELERYLLNFARRSRVYPELLYLDAAGREVVHIRDGKTAPRRDGGHSLYFAKARSLGLGGWWSSGIRDHPGLGEAEYYVRAVHDETDVFKGAIVLVHDVGQFVEVLQDAASGRNARAYLKTPERVFPGSAAAASPRETIAGRTALADRPWTVVVETPLEEWLRPLWAVRSAAVATALFGLAVLLAVIFLSVRSITRPIAELVEAARRLGEGDLAYRIRSLGKGEIGTLSAAFNEMAARLDADRRRNDELQRQLIQAEKVAAAGLLLSSVAHELSNPIQVVAGHAQLLNHQVFPPGVHRILEQIQAAAMRCGRIVTNMLLFVRSSRDTRKPVDMAGVLKSALDLMNYQLTRSGNVHVSVEVDPALPEVQGDFQQLSQVLVNLISNARDALGGIDSRPRELTLRLHAGSRWLTVEVRDNGPGVPPELGERVFEPFVTTKEPGRGTGLGLYICRQIAEAHQGTLAFESSPGQATTFRLRLPLGPQEERREPALVEPEAVAGKRVLIADDEADVAGVIAHALAAEGDELVLVHDGAEAVGRLRAERFDLVISDIEMQGVKGYEIYASARKHPLGAIPVLIATGNALDRQVQRFFDESCVPYVVKPFDTHCLRRAVRRLLGGAELRGLQS